jgi:acyl-CoA thioester hydrolase
VTAEAPTSAPLSYGRLTPVTVHFDDLDALGLLHNARYPLLVERAWGEFLEEHGFRFAGDWVAAGDACNAVKELRISYEAPVTEPGTVDGSVTYARGTRVLVRLDPVTMRPAPWSEDFRAAGRALLRSAD